jgi:hypothetical protein
MGRVSESGRAAQARRDERIESYAFDIGEGLSDGSVRSIQEMTALVPQATAADAQEAIWLLVDDGSVQVVAISPELLVMSSDQG